LSSFTESAIDLSIITISTNEGHELIRSVESVIAGLGGLRAEYFIVDNASTDNTSKIASQYPEITLIRNLRRLGFATNNNLALEKSTGRYVLLLNPDTILDPGTLPAMVAFMDDQTDIGAASCKLVNPDGSIQYTARLFPTPSAVILRWLGYDRIFPNSRTLKKYLLSDWNHASVRDVDWNLGAFLMVRRETMEQIGMLDTAFDPLYYEDIDWCYRIKKAGWRVTYNPHVKIVHLYDRESARTLFNRMTLIHLRNIIRFFIKHWGSRS
jgi:GT2 family glycosyltransferase